MPRLKQKEKKQVTVQVAQDTVHLFSHQLLNSVTKLQLVCEMWSDSEAQLEQLQEETLHILRHEIRFLRRLGQNILQLDHTAGNELSVTLKPVNLVDLVKQIVFSFQLPEQSRKFESDYEAGLPLVWGDVQRLQDVLDNLISNALKYSEPFSPIRVAIQRDHEQARVSITNSGAAIPQGDEQRIFTKFYRGQEHQQPGFGLGLYLADHLIKQHGGRIWVESLPGEKTTTFHFTLLLADQTQSTVADNNGSHKYNDPRAKRTHRVYLLP